MTEMVALYDDDGRPDGVADRARVRAENLRHAATGIVVRNSAGEVYVHRRTTTKDVFAGLYDFCAGGVVQAGEDPAASAAREAAEELGVTGVELRPLGEADYADEHVRYRAFLFECTYDGPIRWQPDEVEWGGWVPVPRLLEMRRAALRAGLGVDPARLARVAAVSPRAHGPSIRVPSATWPSRSIT